MMNLTRHNGRSGQNGAYNPKHNDRRFDVNNSEHIDPERAKQNVYWDCYQGYHFPQDRDQEDKIVYSFEQIERAFYSERYDDFCEAQHERNRKTGHSNRNRTTEDLRLDKKTCPEESLIQIGTMEESVSPEVLAEIAIEFFSEFERRFGEHIHILDWSLHLDEATPHIHERHVFDCENRYGEIAPQQEKALEALGFDLPNLDQKPGKLNNRKMTFDATCRALLFDITLKHGLHLNQEPEYGGRAYLEKQDYILMKQKEKLAQKEQQLSETQQNLDQKSYDLFQTEVELRDKQVEVIQASQELKAAEEKMDALTLRISDTEKFIEDVTEIAYETAVDVVTDKVIEETHNADFDEIEKLKTSLTSERSGNTPQVKKIVAQTLDRLMKKFQGLTQHITDRLERIFGDPVQKRELQEPVRKSVRKLLRDYQSEADAYNAARHNSRNQPQRRNRDMER